jgi:hypothetical protein
MWSMKRTLVGILVAVGFGGCSRARPAVDFVGRSKPPIVAAALVIESEVLPRNAERLGRLVARCRAFDIDEAFESRPLSDMDCSETRLRLWLREAAADHGGDVVAELHCRMGHTSECSALLARRTERERASEPLASPVPATDVEGGFGARIWVSYVPIQRQFAQPLRKLEGVKELSSLPLSHFVIGRVETECEGCDERSLRQAMLVVASRVGPSDVVRVHCLAGGPIERCVGELAVPQSD